MILALRTDKPEAELYIYKDESSIEPLNSLTWEAHRQLSDTLLLKIDNLLQVSSLEKTDLKGIIVFEGPGSFTGLRIGITVANTLAYGLNIPIAGAMGNEWQLNALAELKKQTDFNNGILPYYGSEAHITQPRK